MWRAPKAARPSGCENVVEPIDTANEHATFETDPCSQFVIQMAAFEVFGCWFESAEGWATATVQPENEPHCL
jgi:hypothetical protein